MRNLGQPLSRDAVQMLYQLQNSQIGSCEHFDETYPQVLPLDLYLTLERRRKERREEEHRKRQEQQNGVQAEDQANRDEVFRNFLAECEHIHNKVLFDCINDSLLQFKPYGKEGKPVPWSRQNRRLKPTEDFQVRDIFEIVKHDVSTGGLVD